MSSQVNVVINGTVADGWDRDSVISSLAHRFKIELAKAAALLKGQPSVVKKGVDRATAEQLCAAITKLGARATVEPADTAAPVASVAAASEPEPRSTAVTSAASEAAPKALVPDPRGLKFKVH